MTQDSKNKWSVIINIALTTITAVLSALGFTIGWPSLWQTHEPPRVVRGCFFIHGSHGEHGNFVEGDSTNRKEAVFTYGLFYNKININHCTIDFNNNYNYLRCKYTNNNDMFQIFWALFFIMSHDRSMTPSPSVTVWQFDSFQKRIFCVTNNR